MRWEVFMRDTMEATEHRFEGAKQLFLRGSASDYDLKDLVGLFIELKGKESVLRLLVASHDTSPASLALIVEYGGRGAVGKALSSFRANLPTLVARHRSVVFGKRKAISKDADNKLVIALKELSSCDMTSSFNLTCVSEPLVWVRRDDNTFIIAREQPVMLEESAGAFAGSALSFLPETSFKVRRRCPGGSWVATRPASQTFRFWRWQSS
jgi:hypothetical protein